MSKLSLGIKRHVGYVFALFLWSWRKCLVGYRSREELLGQSANLSGASRWRGFLTPTPGCFHEGESPKDKLMGNPRFLPAPRVLYRQAQSGAAGLGGLSHRSLLLCPRTASWGYYGFGQSPCGSRYQGVSSVLSEGRGTELCCLGNGGGFRATAPLSSLGSLPLGQNLRV